MYALVVVVVAKKRGGEVEGEGRRKGEEMLMVEGQHSSNSNLAFCSSSRSLFPGGVGA